MKSRFEIFFFFISLVMLVGFDSHLALHKPFWLDEANAQLGTCARSYMSMFLHGGESQCSPAPLYYFLERASVSVFRFQSSILLTYRLVSLCSALGLVAVLFQPLRKKIGFVEACFAGSLLVGAPIFHQFAAEDRPYMFWTLLFGALLLYGSVLTARICREDGQDARVSTSEWVLFSGLGVLLSLVSGAGFLQAGGALFGIVLVLRGLRAGAKLWLPIILGAVFVAIGFFYRGQCDAVEGPFNLFYTHDLHLLLSVVSLLIPKESLSTQILTLFPVLGIAWSVKVFWRLIRRKGSLDFSQSLGLHALIQLAVTVIIGLLVAVKGYYFIQRVFIFLIVLNALFAALGLRWILAVIYSRFKDRQWLFAISVFCLALSLVRIVHARSTVKGAYFKDSLFVPDSKFAMTSQDCARFGSELVVWYRPDPNNLESALNLLAELQSKLKVCGPASYFGKTFVILDNRPEAPWLRVSETTPEDSDLRPMIQSGKKVEIFRTVR